MRFIYFLLFLLCFFSCSDIEDVPAISPEKVDVDELFLVDKEATKETKALYSNLWAIQSNGFMFGHHDDLLYGRKWYNEEKRSDTKDVCGDYPAVFSFDVGEIIDDRSDTNIKNIKRKAIIEAYNRGEVLLACAHLNNPLTGGDSWDNSNDEVVKKILEEGSNVNIKFKLWLDRLADFSLSLKGNDNQIIPIIFRPFHEHTQVWSWWGSKCTTEQEFINLWRFTIDYLRNKKGVHNFIYAISPQIDSILSKDVFLFRWPGNSYVDFLGIDSYHGLNPLVLKANLDTLSKLSKELKKPCGITETGVEGVPDRKYWTQQILEPSRGQFLSMIVLWRNKYDPTEEGKHFYSVFPGHESEEDFKKMYKNPRTFFSSDLPRMYKMVAGVEVN